MILLRSRGSILCSGGVMGSGEFQRPGFLNMSSSGWLTCLHCRTADAYRVGTSLTDDGVYASDHRPVFIDITLEH